MNVSRAIDDVVRYSGLYPYLDTASDPHNIFVRETMKLEHLPQYTLHAGQVKALGPLLRGESLVLSAPTSFGKSLLVDAIIATRSPSTCVIVLPTLALLDEYRKRMEQRFPRYQVITRESQAQSNDYVIYLGTQERLESRSDINEIDLFVIDEFYKLDLRRSDERSASLNAVMARYARIAKQVYLLGPSISSINESEVSGLHLPFMRSSFSPVAVDILDFSNKKGDIGTLVGLLEELRGEPTLIYVRSPNSASKLIFELMSKYRPETISLRLRMLSDWLAKSYHEEWALTHSIRIGIGIHHGRIPRALAQYQINLFNKRKLPLLVCTSSMIEGVNTAAKNIIIYDGHISKDKLDRFTFDNIRGRAGRMFQHFVGRVYLFHKPPEPELFDVEIPLLNGFETASDEVLASVPKEALGTIARRRYDSLANSSLVSETLLKRWGRFGVDGLSIVFDAVRDRIDADNTEFMWSGFGSYAEIVSAFEIVWNDLSFNKHSIASPGALAFFATRLRKSASLNEFISSIVADRKGLAAQPEIDRCFNFLRGAEFTFPEVLRAASDIVAEVNPAGACDYSFFAQSLQNWFASDSYRELEEFGIPFPISSRFKFSEDQTFEDRLQVFHDYMSDDRLEQDILLHNLSTT